MPNEIELLVQVHSEPTTEKKKIALPFFYRDNEHSPTLIRLHKESDKVIKTTVSAYGKQFCITSDAHKDEPIPAKAVIISQAAFDTVYDAIVDRLIHIENELE